MTLFIDKHATGARDGKTIASACRLLDIMQARYPGLQNRDVDYEGPEHNDNSGAWRNDAILQDINSPQGGNQDTKEAKTQRVYQKHLNDI